MKARSHLHTHGLKRVPQVSLLTSHKIWALPRQAFCLASKFYTQETSKAILVSKNAANTYIKGGISAVTNEESQTLLVKYYMHWFADARVTNGDHDSVSTLVATA
jgi:hypothetical protein